MTALPAPFKRNPAGRRSRRTSTYTRLGDALASLSPDHGETVLGFPEIERLLGRALPPSSLHVSFWTARAQTGIGRALRRAGFHADLIIDERGPAIRFTRRAPVLRLLHAADVRFDATPSRCRD